MTVNIYSSRAFNNAVAVLDPINGHTYMFCFENGTGDGFITKIQASGGVVNKRISTMVGNPLNFPVADPTDEHYAVAVYPDGDGILHVCGGFHNTSLRMVKQSSVGTIVSWTTENTDAAFNASSVWCFPDFNRFSDGTLLLTIFRSDNSNASMNLAMYRRAPGAGWVKLTDLTQGIGATLNYGSFPSCTYIDKNDWIHQFFSWAGNITTSIYDRPGPIGYLISKDKGTTWRDIAGNLVSVPLVGAAQTVGPISIGTSPFSDSNLLSGVCTEPGTNYPYLQVINIPFFNTRIVRWNGTSWDTLSLNNNGINAPGSLIPWQGSVWMLGQRRSDATDPGRVQFFRYDAVGGPRLSSSELDQGWVPQYDREYFKQTGLVRTYCPNIDYSPRFFTWGNGARGHQ